MFFFLLSRIFFLSCGKVLTNYWQTEISFDRWKRRVESRLRFFSGSLMTSGFLRSEGAGVANQLFFGFPGNELQETVWQSGGIKENEFYTIRKSEELGSVVSEFNILSSWFTNFLATISYVMYSSLYSMKSSENMVWKFAIYFFITIIVN